MHQLTIIVTKNILLVIMGIILPLLIEKVKGESLNNDFKLKDLSKILAVFLPYYGILFIHYEVINVKNDNFQFDSLMKVALTLAFIFATLKYSPLKASERNLLGFPRIELKSTPYLIIMIFFIYTSLTDYFGVTYLADEILLQLHNLNILEAVNDKPFLSISALVIVEIISITGEEIVFRYFAINALRKKLKKNSVIIISSLIWMLMHWGSNFGIIVLGLLLGFLYYDMKSLSLCIVLHFIFNMTVLTEPFYLFYKKSGYLGIPTYQYALALFLFQVLLYHLAELIFVTTRHQKINHGTS